MVKLIKLAKMVGVCMRLITVALSGAPGYCIDQLSIYHSYPVFNLPCIFLPITWSCRIFSFIL